MRKFLLSFLMMILGISLYAQKAIISGVIMDEQKLSLPGATIKLNPGNRYTISDVYGKFEFLNVPVADNYTLEVSYIGYKAHSEKVSAKDNKAAAITIVLKESDSDNQQVVVIGDRLRGQAKALNQQKNNPNITNIVSADQVGRFPDDNIGDAMKRIPGITMQNDQGEARNIIVRGLASELNSVTLNGDRIPSAEGDNRKVQMDLIPADMIQTIEVNKTLTPDMDADAIGGSVNLITRAAPNGQRLSATLSGGYNPIRTSGAYNASLVYGTRFAQNKLGVVFSGSYKMNDFGSDNVEASWVEDKFGNAYVEEHDVRKYDVKRTRRSAALAFDYKINNRHQLTFNAMYNWRDDWENRFRARTRGIKPVYNGEDIIGFTGTVRRQTKGGIDNNRVDNRRLEEQKVQKYSLRGDHLFGNVLDMDWTVNYSRAGEYRPNERYIEFQSGTYNYTSFGTPERPIFIPTNSADLSTNKFRELTENTDDTYEEDASAKVNFRVPLSIINGQKGRLRFGGVVRFKNKVRNNTFNEYEPLNNALATLAVVPNTTFDGKNWQPDSRYVPGTFASAKFLGGLNLTNTSLFEATSVPGEYLPLNYNAKERIIGGYVRWDQDITNKLSYIIGARIEQTHIDYSANVTEDSEDLTGKREVKNTYANIFPSLTLKYNINEDFILRAAVSTATARPNYYSLSPYVNLLPSDQEIDAGNADLKAAFAWNYDVMAEYYFKSVGLISGGAFYKKINNFIYKHRDEAFTTAKFATTFPDLTNPVPAGENWLLTQYRNGENVDVYGFEVALQRQLDFLPGKFLKGFGIYTNYTYTKSKAKGIYNNDGELREGIMLPGTAPHMFNASLSWENKVFSARVSLNYAAAYIDELGGSAFADRYYDKQLFLDANASYKFTKNFRLFVEANNLTNQALRYYQGIKSRTMQMEYYMPRYTMGVKFDILK
ncbi:TonB-dependent receptor [Polluticaenibacter yanchengensis]|uniref:TonB-dependent receptor n=1 Tax=Polluticaenibacter yanchengensis TaxID=3014562 RepID=A0ABT4UGJ2_9BACT|nr:TonB-dependent receptor [Chitinophagaceae bacterium LY-5]